MARKTKSVEELILDGFEGSRAQSRTFASMTDDEYIGYVTAVTTHQNPSNGAHTSEILLEVRKLFKAGKL